MKPKAGFYIFPKVDVEKFGIEDDEEFVLDLLKETGVLVVNGSGFNWMEMDHFRVVFLAEVDVMERAMDEMEKYLNVQLDGEQISVLFQKLINMEIVFIMELKILLSGLGMEN